MTRSIKRKVSRGGCTVVWLETEELQALPREVQESIRRRLVAAALAAVSPDPRGKRR